MIRQSLSADTLNQALGCMKYELMRLGSFKSFPRQSEGRPIKLAKAGFVFTGTRDDTVTCFTCGITKNNWLKYDDPLQFHKDLNPRCHFINNTSENVPILIPQSIVYNKIWTTLHETYCSQEDTGRGVTDYDLSLVKSHKRMSLHLKLNIKKEDLDINTGSWDSILTPTDDMSCASREFNGNDGTNLRLHVGDNIRSVNGGQEVFGDEPARDSIISIRTDMEAAVERVGIVDHEPSDPIGITGVVQQLSPSFNDTSCSVLAPVAFGVLWLYNRCIYQPE